MMRTRFRSVLVWGAGDADDGGPYVLKGISTQLDFVRKVAAPGLDPREVLVADVATMAGSSLGVRVHAVQRPNLSTSACNSW